MVDIPMRLEKNDGQWVGVCDTFDLKVVFQDKSIGDCANELQRLVDKHVKFCEEHNIDIDVMNSEGRPVQLNVRISSYEKSIIKAAAKAMDCSQSEFLRNAAFDKAVKTLDL